MIRYLSLFSGIGAFEKALDNLGIPYELLAYCEVDKYASKAYSLLHHVPESMNRIYSPEGLAPTLKTVSGGGREVKVLTNGRYRKLTPKEYFRLMGFSDSDYELLAMNGISKTQIYKMAGNSIVVTVLEHLFKQIYTPGTQSIDSLKKKSLDILNTL